MAHKVELAFKILQRMLSMVFSHLLKSLFEFLIKSSPDILGHCKCADLWLKKSDIVEVLVWEVKIFIIIMFFV